MVVHGKLIFEYSKINKDIYIGTNQCCQVHLNSKLIKKGIRADISLEGKKIDQPFGAKYYLWLPTKDHIAPTQQQLSVGVAHINDLVKNKISVYIHCQRGHGRAPTLVAAYLISKGMGVKEAISYIKKRRKKIHPNKKQIRALEIFKRRLKK